MFQEDTKVVQLAVTRIATPKIKGPLTLGPCRQSVIGDKIHLSQEPALSQGYTLAEWIGKNQQERDSSGFLYGSRAI
jgi:hypothetical protein